MPLPPLTAPGPALQATLFASWYPNFRKVSPKATVIDVLALQPDFLEWMDRDGLVLPKGSGRPAGKEHEESDDEAESQSDDDDEPRHAPTSFPQLDARIREVIRSYDGACFPKLNWSAPLDAAWIVPGSTLRCTTPGDVYLLLKSSDFITSDIEQSRALFESTQASASAPAADVSLAASDEMEVSVSTSAPKVALQSVPCSLVLKKWFDMPPSHEFRCFVRAGRLLCATQRDRTFYEHLQPASIQTTIRKRLAEFFESHLKPRTPPPGAKPGRDAGFSVPDFTFDAYLTRGMEKVFLVDVGPYLPRTDALLWSWDEVEAKAEQLQESSAAAELPELRILTDRTQANQAAPTHAHNMVPRDLLERSEGKGIADFAREWEESLKAAAVDGDKAGGDKPESAQSAPAAKADEATVPQKTTADAVQGSEPAEAEKNETEEDEEDDEAETSQPVGQASFFAALNANAGEASDDDDDLSAAPRKSKSSRKKKKKKAAAPAIDAQAEAQSTETEPTAALTEVQQSATAGEGAKGGKRKKKPSKATGKKAAGKAEGAKDIGSMSMSELSELLASQAGMAEASTSNKTERDAEFTSAPAPTGPISALRPLLALAAPALDPTVELKRQFGAAAIRAYEAEHGGTNDGSASGLARARAQAWNSNARVRNVLVQPADTWPPIARTFTGIDMELHDVEGRGRLGAWVHSRAYRQAQLQFLQAVQSYDPNQLMALTRRYPWHIDTLLQLSDVSRHQGDLGQAGDFNSRALFAYERTALPAFTGALTSASGPPQLDFGGVENRGFWLAAHRHINFLGRRGTWRTALEWAKLVLGLDAPGDPHAIVLWLDFLSIKARQHSWFLEMLPRLDAAVARGIENSGASVVSARTPFDEKDKVLVGETQGAQGALDWCVGIQYARALALRAQEKEDGDKTGERSSAALRLAIARHPCLLPLLFDKIGLAFPPEMRSHEVFSVPASRWSSKTDTLSLLLSNVYVSRSESLWREAPTSKWLSETLAEAWPALRDGARKLQPAVASQEQRRSVYRHVLVSDLPDALRQTLIGFFPPAVTGGGDSLDAWDPLPPTTEGSTRYDDAYFQPLQREMERQRSRTAAAGMPAGGIGAALQNLMGMLRGVNGLEEWGAAMENMDDEAREDLLAELMHMTAEQRRQRGADEDEPPGGFGRVAEQEGGGDEQGGVVQAFANALRGWWGPGAELPPDGEEGEEDEDEDGFETDEEEEAQA